MSKIQINELDASNGNTKALLQLLKTRGRAFVKREGASQIINAVQNPYRQPIEIISNKKAVINEYSSDCYFIQGDRRKPIVTVECDEFEKQFKHLMQIDSPKKKTFAAKTKQQDPNLMG